MSDSNVVDLSHFRKTSAAGSELREKGPSPGDILRLRQIETVTKGKGPVFGITDRMVAAQAIWLLVREAKRTGVTGQQIKEELERHASAGKKPGTARLERYMLSQELNPEVAKQKSLKLPQRVFGYLQAAAAIAQLTGQSSDDLKVRLLKETTVWHLEPRLDEIAEDPRAAHLLLLLREMAQRVIRRTKLAELFSRARRIPGAWDHNLNCFTHSLMACIFQPHYLGATEHWTEAPPLPSVPLVRCAHAEISTTVRLERQAVANPRTDETASSDQFDGQERSVSLCLRREIRLALGPTTAPEVIGPMFESRANVEMQFIGAPQSAANKTCLLFPSMTLKPVDDVSCHVLRPVFQVLLDDGWHRAAALADLDTAEALVVNPGDDPLMWAPNPLDPGDYPVEHWYHSWIPMNEQSVAYWLDRATPGNRTKVCTPSGETRGRRAVWYAQPNAAAEVEEALINGWLQNGLEVAITQLRQALDMREAKWLNDASTSTAMIIQTWRDDDAQNQ